MLWEETEQLSVRTNSFFHSDLSFVLQEIGSSEDNALEGFPAKDMPLAGWG